jgi:hypothetical protein
MNVKWRENRDGDGVLWNDLVDPTAKTMGAGWVITYRDYYSSWHVMWNTLRQRRDDQLISKSMPEEQLRDRLKTEYLLTRGET